MSRQIFLAPIFATPLMLTLACTSAFAQAQKSEFSDFHQADLIFQETTGRQSIAVKAATSSAYTHMGIIRITSDGPVVIEAGRTVTETPLKDFVDRGRNKRFAVYRVKGLSETKSRQILKNAAADMGKPYDLFFRLDSEAIYCSELPYRAFKAAGEPIGTVEKVGKLNISVASAVALIDSRWKKHPDCRSGTREACIAKLNDQDIVTPVSIARDRRLYRVYSNF